jgi:hypothetical protein
VFKNVFNRDNIVALSEYRPMQRSPLVAEVKTYWDRLRNGRAAPTRAEIDARGLQNALGNAFLIDRIAPGHARFRIAGMHLCDLMGMEVRGMPLSALFEVSARPALSEHLEAVFSTPEVVEFGLTAEGGVRHEALSGQMILLPLLDSAGLGTHALGCIEVEGTIGQHPRRLLIAGTRRQAILRPVSDNARRMGFAEAVASYQPPVASARPQLRLVKSDG